MASADSTHTPVKGQAYRFRGVIRSTATGNPITGGLTDLAAQISKDDGNFTATAAPVEIQTSGYFYLDLTAEEMTCNGAVVRITASNANALELAVEIKPGHLSEVTGRADAAAVKRLEAYMVQAWMASINKEVINRTTGADTRYLADGVTVSVTGTVEDDGNIGTRGKLS